jgi:hypothetical protein
MCHNNEDEAHRSPEERLAKVLCQNNQTVLNDRFDTRCPMIKLPFDTAIELGCHEAIIAMAQARDVLDYMGLLP